VNLPPTAAIRENDLQIGQRVVYPNQGVCRIVGIETREIGGVRAEFLTMKREEDGATVMVPRSKLSAIGLRHVAQPGEIEAILKFFEAESGDPELDWKVRHRTHADKMTDGSLTGTAEVLKALHSLSERRPLPQKERELYDSARHLVVNEVAVALSVPRATGEDIVDFCLTPAAGSPRAAQKAKLKAEREAAEESALLDELGDIDVPGLGADAEMLEAPAEDAKAPAAAAKGEKPKGGAKKEAPKPTAKKSAPAPKKKAAGKPKAAAKAKAAKPKPAPKKAGKASPKRKAK